jgi:murein DD-endopeptidase MepM/ murein hydrolase activator NlpD
MRRTVVALCAALIAAAPLVAQEDQYLNVNSVQTEDGGYAFYAENSHSIPLHVTVRFSRLTNLNPSVSLPLRRTIEPGAQEVPLLQLTVKDPSKSRGYSISYSYVRGDPEAANHNDDYLYLLPFQHGTKHRVTQGFQGEFSHYGENEYGVDFDMEVGTPVHASRAGRVVEVVESYTRGGRSGNYATHANRILVYHEDGTFSNYAHLKRNGAVVEEGDTIVPGQHIGYSGNTGRSSGPHLHFDVRKPTRNGMQSIPFRFRGEGGEPITPSLNEVYYAYHPGGPEFEEQYGAELAVSDFRDHSKSIRRNGKIDVRTENEDLTYVVYLRNGFAREIDATINFRLRGMRSERSLPIEMTVPATTEVFLTLLRASPNSSSWEFAPQIRYRFAE